MKINFTKKYFLLGVMGAVLVLPIGLALAFGQTYGNTGTDDSTGTFYLLLPSLIVLTAGFILSVMKRQ